MSAKDYSIMNNLEYIIYYLDTSMTFDQSNIEILEKILNNYKPINN